jgi:hypothetical protein
MFRTVLLSIIRSHLEFYLKNKFEKLVHLIDFIRRIYHDAWSPERQIFQAVFFYMERTRTEEV